MRRASQHPLKTSAALMCASLFGAGWSLCHVLAALVRPVEHRAAWVALLALFALSTAVSVLAAVRRRESLVPITAWRVRIPLVATFLTMSASDLLSSVHNAGHLDADLALVGMVLAYTLFSIATVTFGYACVRTGIAYLERRRKAATSRRETPVVRGESRPAFGSGRFASQNLWTRPPPELLLTA